MYCGSCLHDNTLVTELRRLGHDATLLPLYTPIRTDEADVSESKVFYGGVNIYLQQRFPWLRHLPRRLDGWLNKPGILRKLVKNPTGMNPEATGALTLSLLNGDDGRQKKELARLVEWLGTRSEGQPDLINLSNLLIAGCVPTLRAALRSKVVVTLQGDDLFLESLPVSVREEVVLRLRTLVPLIDQFIVYSQFYADKMGSMLDIDHEKIAIVPLGIEPIDRRPTPCSDRPPTIGYFARICPHKGLHLLADAFLELRQLPAYKDCRLHVAGWLGKQDQPYFEEQLAKIRRHGALEALYHAGSPDREGKHLFLSGLDVFSVPSVYDEPKGLSSLEAMAAGIPCVLPDSGIYPELIQTTEGGCLHRPNDVPDLTRKLGDLLQDSDRRRLMGASAQRNIEKHHHATGMAEAVLALYRNLL
jgi:glycosyltransferase involved in cell wall biosynthesis